MSFKILVADDSQTIQKVISLASKEQDFNLVSCLDESELFDNLNKNTDLVLLDFALSDELNGYELCKKIIEEQPNVPVMAMLGVFDSIDENEYQNSGFADKIVKPFETERFIHKCIALLNNENIETEKEDSEHEGWSVSSDADEIEDVDHEDNADEDSDVTTEIAVSEIANDNLSNELSGWGFDPNELVKKDVTQHYDEFPPVIEDEIEEEDELDYIDKTQEMTLPDLSDDHEETTKEFELAELKLEKDITPVEREISLSDDVEFEDLKSELADEIEEDLGDTDLWSVDEDTQDDEELTQEITLENIESAQVAGSQNEIEQQISSELSTLPDDLKDAIKADLEPLVEKYVQEYCKKEVEKLIWEIIPDLAENIVKKELSTIRETVISSIKN